MHTPRFTIAILFLTLFSHTPTFGMITYKDLEHPDIRQHIFKNLPENELSVRLVCKNWAQKNDQWKFMPDSVEREYDRCVKRKGILKSNDKATILFILTAKNDFEAVQWLLPITNNSGISLMDSDKDEYIDIPFTMIAIHNNNANIAQLLINNCDLYKDLDWKHCYDTITVPDKIATCLPINNNRDFSFLFYLIAAWSDNNDYLQQLYAQKKPTYQGQEVIIAESLRYNAQNCFTYLLAKKTTKKIIQKNSFFFFMAALNNNTKELPQMLIKNKLFQLNKPLRPRITALDICEDTVLLYRMNGDNKKADRSLKKVAILKELGAKTYAQIQKEEKKEIEFKYPNTCAIL